MLKKVVQRLIALSLILNPIAALAQPMSDTAVSSHTTKKAAPARWQAAEQQQSSVDLSTEYHDAHLAEDLVTAPRFNSHSVLVLNRLTGEVVYEKNTHQKMPIASISKLMTAMVVLDSGASLEESITITEAEIDRLKGTSSRLAIGTTLTRRDLLLLALMSSENRAAAALARAHPGGSRSFIEQMNLKALQLGMTDTTFYDPTGLDMRNRSTARDLARLVGAAELYPLVRAFSTTPHYSIYSASGRPIHYKNSNALIRDGRWEIALQKTGYIQEAGRCMVMHAMVGTQPLIIVLLAANGSSARINDARSIKTWLESRPQNWLAG